jgi:sulfate transport system permease protein
MVLPGFRITLGFTLTYTALIVLIPLSLLVWHTSHLTAADFFKTVSNPQVMASYKLTFTASLLAAITNAVFGFISAWALVRYRFPCRKLLDSIVDLPFAIPTAVSGIALTTFCADSGWVGGFAKTYGIKLVHFAERYHLDLFNVPLLDSTEGLRIAYTPLGVYIALVFIGLPFVIRTLQPALTDFDREIEDAAYSLGANKVQTFWRIIFPSLIPALLTGFVLAFARALGEYGSVIFIAGNIPYETEITSQLIYTQLEEFEYPKATAIALVMLVASFLCMFIINIIQWFSARYSK